MPSTFLQTPEWLTFQRAQGKRVWRLDDGFIRANIIRHDVRAGKNFLYIPHGPELNLMGSGGIRNEISHFARHIRYLAKEQGSMFVKIEPLHDEVIELLHENGLHFHHNPNGIQPNRTVTVDLSRSEDDLLSAMHHKTRYNLQLAERKGVLVNEISDPDRFWSLMERTTERDKFRSHTKEYYRSLLSYFSKESNVIRTRLFGALFEGKVIAAALVLEHGTTAYYLHGASDYQHRALMGPFALHWRMMLRYKGAGFGTYDFWGIDADAYPGVTRFKLGWGGRVVERPGSFDLVVRPVWHWLYNHLPR